MGAPTDPGFRFGFSHVEQIGEGCGLQRQGKIAHGFDGLLGERFAEQAIYQCFHLGDDLREFCALEKRFHDLAIGRVFGRVGFDGQLPHRSQVFFGRNRHAVGGVGAKCAPVFRRLPHIGVAKHHGDVLALNMIDQNAVILAGLFEGIVKRARHVLKN